MLDVVSETFGPCKTCVFVLERIKKGVFVSTHHTEHEHVHTGTNMLLPSICSEIYLKYPSAYAQVLCLFVLCLFLVFVSVFCLLRHNTQQTTCQSVFVACSRVCSVIKC